MVSQVIKFFIEGDPIAHRYEIVKRGNYSSLAKTKKYRTWREHVGWHVVNAKNRGRLGYFEKGTPLGISFTFRFKRPKSVKREHHTVTPDLNNIIKPIEDALKGVLIHDDCAIVHYGDTWKIYCAPGEPAGVSVTLWEVEEG